MSNKKIILFLAIALLIFGIINIGSIKTLIQDPVSFFSPLTETLSSNQSTTGTNTNSVSASNTTKNTSTKAEGCSNEKGKYSLDGSLNDKNLPVHIQVTCDGMQVKISGSVNQTLTGHSLDSVIPLVPDYATVEAEKKANLTSEKVLSLQNDFNFDGYADLEILRTENVESPDKYINGKPFYNRYVYSPAEHKFTRVNDISFVGELSTYEPKKLLIDNALRMAPFEMTFRALGWVKNPKPVVSRIDPNTISDVTELVAVFTCTLTDKKGTAVTADTLKNYSNTDLQYVRKFATHKDDVELTSSTKIFKPVFKDAKTLDPEMNSCDWNNGEILDSLK